MQMRARTIAVCGIGVLAVAAAGVLGYKLHSAADEVHQLSTQVILLEEKQTAMEQEAAQQAEYVTGLQNLFPQYILESETILSELSTAVPFITYETGEEGQMMDVLVNWIMAHRIAEKNGLSVIEGNKVILSLKPLGLEPDGTYRIQAGYYELPVPVAPKDGYPRLPGKDYIGQGQFYLQKQDGAWQFLKFANKL